MKLRLYNTLTRTKEEFLPIDPANVRMYVCGPTVYDRAHIGNARPLIVFDLLFRLLRQAYGPLHVKYVRNITDVDDKINARAAEQGISIRALTEATYAGFREDVDALGCLPPTVEPRATDHIAEMHTLIERLVANGHAYVADDHVLFDVASMPTYGRLANRSLDEMLAGARVDVAPYKRSGMDFVLWKPSTGEQPGWPSPAGIEGQGRPGWHIECSAMSWKYLGEVFDIHGGGIDLVFPHHENELAQSCCAFGGEVMAKYWLHNGFLQVEGEKMSKSLGNFVTLREVLANWRGGAVRLTMLGTHYRQPIDWTSKALRDADEELSVWATRIMTFGSDRRWRSEFHQEVQPSSYLLDALTDDLNTPDLLAGLRTAFKKCRSTEDFDQLYRDVEFLGLLSVGTIGAYNSHVAVRGPLVDVEAVRGVAARAKIAVANTSATGWTTLADEATCLGLSIHKQGDGSVTVEVTGEGENRTTVEDLVLARTAARASREFVVADRIGNMLRQRGIVLKDSPDGTTWEVAP